jgi:hypothetical protein
MFIGHLGIALAAKRVAPTVSTGVAVAAATGIDLVWPLFVLAGLERVEIDPGNTALTPLNFVQYPYTHSLLAVLGWSVLAGLLVFAVQRSWRGAAAVGALVTSHWVLDLLVHRPDLPLWPGGPAVGLGLWNVPVVAIPLELAIFFGGVLVYAKTTRPLDRVGRWAFGSFVALVTAIHAANLGGPPPPSAEAVAGVGLAAWILVPWAGWFDLHRRSRLVPNAPPLPGIPAA